MTLFDYLEAEPWWAIIYLLMICVTLCYVAEQVAVAIKYRGKGD